jgi:glycerol-3-phosphate acyltransferase PlsY
MSGLSPWLLVPAAYIAGGVPFGLLLGRAWGHDVLAEGSGNIGATNVWRTCGPVPGAMAWTADVLKGLLPTLLAAHLAPGMATLKVAAGLAALLGHVCSPFLGFRGGKGVSTAWGLVLGLDPYAALPAVVVWVVLVRLTGFVSVGSLAGTLTTGVISTCRHDPIPVQTVIWLCAAVIWIRHRANLVRLWHGEELRPGHQTEPPKEPES